MEAVRIARVGSLLAIVYSTMSWSDMPTKNDEQIAKLSSHNFKGAVPVHLVNTCKLRMPSFYRFVQSTPGVQAS